MTTTQTPARFRIVPFTRRDGWTTHTRWVVVDGRGHNVDRFDTRDDAIAHVDAIGGIYVIESESAR